MLAYIIRRVFILIPTLLGVSLIVFFMLRLTPGDPAELMLGERATEESLHEVREHLGLNEPLHVQYGMFMKRLMKGDLGETIFTRQKVWTEIKHRFPATLELSVCALFISCFVGIILGIVSATKQYSVFDYLSMLGALTGVSMPIFWLGLVLMLIFSVNLGWLPISGRLSVLIDLEVVTNFYVLDSIITKNWVALKDSIWHLIMPAVTLSTIPTAIIARMTRSSMLEVLKQDYIKTAMAKGLSKFKVVYKHALRNALIPVVTTIGLQFGVLLCGAILTETIFAWPGVGKWMYEAVMQRDYMVIQGGTLVIATIFIVINLFVDLLYAIINPKISIK
ncbi:MAG: ABC transporter permease [Desulfobacula sp.]|jgi:peptide/nickel transport system permease protein|uniref:ABC transporter permease n=1 Tax=Desulfobacula sp. TaxID=2593537 RepID=UPI001D7C1019|nr:ABC transporter permease [Desulfobacula sp.]MBT3486822.1 ABC transporter permease [Desulfobacula sp.]MBT3803434.1 ABC transporter permease [Desulfobacula sp.]MBT4024355.1 ABC transporter permease [Desulfobacula sp.]MBT4199666.1 ABC transporter permease [Desulfobacula sp.]